MRSLLRWSIVSLLLGCATLAADDTRSGRLVTGCVDRSIQSEFCSSIVRYQPKGAPILPKTMLTAEQRAVESALPELTPVQPAQVQGSMASILMQRKSGEFVVAFLQKRDGRWFTLWVSEPSPSRR